MRDAQGRLDTDEFAARVAAPLKGQVMLDAAFEARVMRAVAESAMPWWRRRQTLTLGPAGMLAAAAALLLMLSGTVVVSRQLASIAPPQLAAASDTVFIVRFVLTEPAARTVVLVGDFNGWSRTATPLATVDASGQWTVMVPVPSGRHEYAFIVDGQRWTADPLAVVTRDEFGNESSVLRVGSALRGT